MNSAVATQETEAKVSPIELYRRQVLPLDRARDLYKSLPAHISPAVFERNLVNALMANPALIKFDPRLVYREVCKAAGLGLLLDPQLGEAYMVVAYNYKTKQQEPQLRIGYRGMCKLARQTGNVTAIYTHEVCENDEVEVDLGHPKTLHHRPRLFGDRGGVIGYIAVITYASGAFDFEPMSVEQTRAIRDRSDAWKAFVNDKIKSTPWSTDEDEMAKKTTLRRLLKRQDQSPEMRTAIEIEDRAEFPDMRPVRAVVEEGEDEPPPPPPPPAARQLTQRQGEKIPMQPLSDEEALSLVTSGRHDPGEEEVWEEPVDEPPPPSARPTRAAALLSKDQLVASIGKITRFADFATWADDYAKDVAALKPIDRGEVNRVFNKAQADSGKRK